MLEKRRLLCRLFLTMHKGFGRFSAWQFWYEVARATLPAQPADPYSEDLGHEPEAQDVTATLLMNTFQDLWPKLLVRKSSPHVH
jgi:hypothetical protein